MIFYKLYALIFNLFRIFPVKKNRVAFIAPHNGGEFDNLFLLYKSLSAKKEYETRLIKSKNAVSGILELIKFLIFDNIYLARSEFIFLNDNFMPMAFMRFSKETVVTQLWHGDGAFKRFGLGSKLTNKQTVLMKKAANRLDFVICSGKNVKSIYACAFGVDESQVLPIGSFRAQELLNSANVDILKQDFLKRYPECSGKKLILYAPTFRDNGDDDKNILSHIDLKQFNNNLSNEYSLLIRLHPTVHTGTVPPDLINVATEDVHTLTLICDILITDYSSICMDFALLLKKCIFFAFDKEKYEADRSFYFDYETYVPGKVCKTFDEVIKDIKLPIDCEKLWEFTKFNFET